MEAKAPVAGSAMKMRIVPNRSALFRSYVSRKIGAKEAARADWHVFRE
jgi:hypothetical protein